MRLRPAKRVSLSELVLEQLLEQMRDGALVPGERLPSEAELSHRLSVGRSSVREALRVLIASGLVETRPGRGAYVLRKAEGILPGIGSTLGVATHLERLALQDVLEVREAIEGRAARLAAERATRSDLQEIDRRALEVERQVTGGKTYFIANGAFHVAVAKASRNQIFVESVRQLLGRQRSFRERLMAEDAPMRERDIAEHRALVEAIRARDGPRAEELAVAHIRSSCDTVLRFGLDATVTPLRSSKESKRTRQRDGTPLGRGAAGKRSQRQNQK